MTIAFNEFKKLLKEKLKHLKFEAKKDWEILLPYKAEQNDIQIVLNLARDNMLLKWHIKFSEVDEEPIRIYWET